MTYKSVLIYFFYMMLLRTKILMTNMLSTVKTQDFWDRLHEGVLVSGQVWAAENPKESNIQTQNIC